MSVIPTGRAARLVMHAAIALFAVVAVSAQPVNAPMQAALEASGYEVIVRGLEGGGRSRSQMLRDISSACRETRPGDTLLVYISSHGVNYGGVDYLIPWDGAIDDVDDYRNHLVPVDFANAVNGGRADTTIFFIDACREGLQLKPTAKGVGVGFGPWGTGQRERRIIELSDVEGRSYREIARVLDCPLGTVMSRLCRARRKLRACLDA